MNMRKGRKSFISFMCVVFVLISMFIPGISYAVGESLDLIINPSGTDLAGKTTLTVDSSQTTVDVQFSINVTGAFSTEFFLQYDPAVIEMTGLTDGIADVNATGGTNYADIPTAQTLGYEAIADGVKTAAKLGKVKFAIGDLSGGAFEPLTQSGVLFTVNFSIKGTGSTDITLGQSLMDGSCIVDGDTNPLILIASQVNTAHINVVGPPVLQSKTTSADGTKVLLAFDKDMDSTTFGTAPCGFAVTTGESNTANPVTAAALKSGDNKVIELTLTNPVYSDTTDIKVAYTAGTVEATDNTVLASFTAQAVTNATTVGQPPQLSSAAVNAEGTKILAVFNKNIDVATLGVAPSGFAVTTGSGNTANVVTNVALNAQTNIVELTLTDKIYVSTTLVKLAYTPGTIKSADNGTLATISGTSVTNGSSVIAPPQFVSADTNTEGTKVLVTFDKAIDGSTLGVAPSGFAVTTGIGNTDNPVTTVALNGSDNKIVELTLTNPVFTSTLNMKLSYTAGTITAGDTTVLASFADKTIANSSTVVVPPEFQSAQTNAAGTKVLVTFDKAMDSTTFGAAPSGFAITMGNSNDANAVTAVALNGVDSKIIELTLTNPVYTTTTNIKVAYTDGTVEAADNSILASFTAQTVTNSSTVVVPPVFSSAQTNVEGTKILVTFDKAMDSTTFGTAPSGFVVTMGVGNTANVVSSVDINVDTKIIELTLTNPIYTETTNIKVAYTAGTIEATDNGILASFTAQSVTNSSTVITPPLFVSAASSADGTKLLVTFDKAMDAATFGVAPSGFVVTIGSGNTANVVTAVAINGSDNKIIELTLTNKIYTDTVNIKVAYTAGTVESTDNGILATFTAQSVTNSTTSVRFTVDTSFTVGSTQDAVALAANQIVAANCSVTNNQAGAQSVVMIVALYNSSNEMVNMSYISKSVAGSATETFNAGFKLPSNVTGYYVKAFVWDGADFTASPMTPVSNAVMLPQ